MSLNEVLLAIDAKDNVDRRDLPSLGLKPLSNGEKDLREEQSLALRRRRFVDRSVALMLANLGWKQCPHEGVMWCRSCGRPTVWRDGAGRPMHHTCADIIG